MPAPARIRAIVPKGNITSKGVEQRVQKWLKEVGEEFKKEMRFYPPRLPGATYRRTRRYRRGWDRAPVITTKAQVVVINNVHYARRVGGPRRARGGLIGQSSDMAIRGWPSVSDVGPAVVKRNRKRLGKLILPLKQVKK